MNYLTIILAALGAIVAVGTGHYILSGILFLVAIALYYFFFIKPKAAEKLDKPEEVTIVTDFGTPVDVDKNNDLEKIEENPKI